MGPGIVAHIEGEIASIGRQTRELAERYEQLFLTLRRALRDELLQTSSAVERAHIAMAMADATASAISAGFPNQPVHDCRAGCNACCHLYVMIPPSVAEAIAAELLGRMDSDELLALRLELENTAAAANALTDPSTLRRRCPLLGEDGLCTIYDVRPPACRAFSSQSAAACQSFIFDPKSSVTSIPQAASQYRVYQEATAALQYVAQARGEPSAQIGLAEALAAVLPMEGLNPQSQE